MRIAFACLGYPVPPKKEKQLLTAEKIDVVLNDIKSFRKYFFGCLLFSELQILPAKNKLAESLSIGFYSIVAICSAKYFDNKVTDDELKQLAQEAISDISKEWENFEDFAVKQFHNVSYFNYNFNYYNGTYRLSSKFSGYFRSQYLPLDLNDFFFGGNRTLIEGPNIRKGKLTIEKYLSSKHLTLEIIENVKPLINQTNWFDENSISEIENSLHLDPRSVRAAIKFITSKEFGYYVSDRNEAHQ